MFRMSQYSMQIPFSLNHTNWAAEFAWHCNLFIEIYVAEDFRTAGVLRHHQEGWNKVETNESDTSDVQSDNAIEEDFPPPPPALTPTSPVVQTIQLGQEAEIRLNVQVSSTGTLEPVLERYGKSI